MTNFNSNWQEQVKKYLEQMREMGTTASQRSLILLTLLAVVWLGGLEPAISEIQAKETIPAQIEKLKIELTKQKTENNRLKNNIKKNNAKIEDDNFVSENQDETRIKLENQKEERSRILQKLQDLNFQIKELKDKGKNISFDSPLFQLVVSINLAPWIWLTLISGLFLYLSFTRSAMLSLYDRAVKICNLQNSNDLDSYTKEALTQTVGILPWWLAPFPHLQNRSSQRDICEIRDVQGWKLTHPYSILKVVLFFILLLLLPSIRIIYIGVKIIKWENSQQGIIDTLSRSTSTTPDWVWFDILLAIISLSFILFGMWLWITPYQDPHDSTQQDDLEEQAPSAISLPKVENVSKKIKRRKFIKFIPYFALAIIVSSLVILPTIFPKFVNQISYKYKIKRRNPRFVTREKLPPLVTKLTPKEFYFNPNFNPDRNIKEKSIIHYVLDNKTILGISKTNSPPNENDWKEASEKRWQQASQKLQDLSLEKSTTPHVHLSSASFSFEQAAIESIKTKDYAQACRFLLDGIRHDLLFQIKAQAKPSFRLYDLLAGLTVRFNQDKYFNSMIVLIQQNPNPKFESRIKKWKDKESTWHKRWSDSKKKIKWQITIMNPKRSQDTKKTERTIVSIDV